MSEAPDPMPPREVGQADSTPPAPTVPETGDVVVDAALRDLAAVDPHDLDATMTAAGSLHATLTSRLSDLGT